MLWSFFLLMVFSYRVSFIVFLFTSNSSLWKSVWGMPITLSMLRSGARKCFIINDKAPIARFKWRGVEKYSLPTLLFLLTPVLLSKHCFLHSASFARSIDPIVSWWYGEEFLLSIWCFPNSAFKSSFPSSVKIAFGLPCFLIISSSIEFMISDLLLVSSTLASTHFV